jgi:hypothetical protein
LKHLQPSSSDPEKDSFSIGRLLRRHAQRPYAAAPWPTIPPPRTRRDPHPDGRALGEGTVVRVGSRVFDASRPSENVTLGRNSRIVEVAIEPDDFRALPPILGFEIVVKIAVAASAEEPRS